MKRAEHSKEKQKSESFFFMMGATPNHGFLKTTEFSGDAELFVNVLLLDSLCFVYRYR